MNRNRRNFSVTSHEHHYLRFVGRFPVEHVLPGFATILFFLSFVSQEPLGYVAKAL